MLCAIVLALLPLIEFVDHWESFGANPEFVSVCTVLGVAFALTLLVRRVVLGIVTRLRTLPLLSAIPAQLSGAFHTSIDAAQSVIPRIRAPIRI